MFLKEKKSPAIIADLQTLKIHYENFFESLKKIVGTTGVEPVTLCL